LFLLRDHLREEKLRQEKLLICVLRCDVPSTRHRDA